MTAADLFAQVEEALQRHWRDGIGGEPQAKRGLAALRELREQHDTTGAKLLECEEGFALVETVATASKAREAALRSLLRERHEFPEFPSPEEGLVSTPEVWLLQEQWREAYYSLDDRIMTILASPAFGEEKA